MRKTTKIIVCALCVLIAAVCVGAGYMGTRGNDGETTTASSAKPIVVDPVTSEPTGAEETTTEKQESTLSELIIGKWTDSAGMSGFEFFKDGKASFTYANLEALGINFDGKIENGTYNLEGNTLTIAYSIYTATIDKKYEISIENDVLTMKDLEEMKTVTFVRSGTNGTADSTTTSVSVSDELYGSWENTSMSKKYKFQNGGKVVVTLDGESFDGVYVTEGDSVTVQYAAYGKKITEKYTFAVTTTALTLTNEAGSSFVFKRAGTGVEVSSDKELLGTWRDSANMSGYEFKENGVVEITYVNVIIPVLNAPINGTYTGAYEISSDNSSITLTQYIFGHEITENYTYVISGNSLKLTNTEDGKTSTYIKQ